MNAKEAVKAAKEYLEDLFSGEELTNLGLEEVVLRGNVWRVTFGFSRPWDYPRRMLMLPEIGAGIPTREYKVVEVRDDSSEAVGVQDRQVEHQNDDI